MIKQRIFIIALCCLLSNWVLAQEGSRRGHSRASKIELTEEMKKELNLSPEQRNQLDAIKAETTAAAQALKARTDLDPKSKRRAMQELKAGGKAKVEGILSAEQRAKMGEIRQAKSQKYEALAGQVDRKALRQEMRSYRQASVEPVMKAQRQQLETMLTEADKATLANIRGEMQSVRTSKRAERGANPGRKAAGNRRKDGARLRERFPEQHQTLVAMVAKYDTQINSLLLAVESQREQWKSGQEAIRDKHVPAELLERRRRRQAKKADRPDRAEKREMRAKIKFLLQDVNAERK